MAESTKRTIYRTVTGDFRWSPTHAIQNLVEPQEGDLAAHLHSNFRRAYPAAVVEVVAPLYRDSTDDERREFLQQLALLRPYVRAEAALELGSTLLSGNAPPPPPPSEDEASMAALLAQRVGDVIAYVDAGETVDDQLERAQHVLNAEIARAEAGEKLRTSLVDALKDRLGITDPASTVDGEGGDDDSAVAGDDDSTEEGATDDAP